MVRYIGKGFLPGVPTRDLTDEEAKEYGIDRLVKSGLYVKEQKISEKARRRSVLEAEEVKDARY